jgi:hypothetical protein
MSAGTQRYSDGTVTVQMGASGGMPAATQTADRPANDQIATLRDCYDCYEPVELRYPPLEPAACSPFMDA